MAETVHHKESNSRCACGKKITQGVTTTTKWAKVTCQNCKAVMNVGWREMS